MKDYKFLCEKYGAFLSEDEEYYFSFREAICEYLYYTERDNLIKQLKRKNSWLLNYIMPFKGNKFFLNGSVLAKFKGKTEEEKLTKLNDTLNQFNYRFARIKAVSGIDYIEIVPENERLVPNTDFNNLYIHISPNPNLDVIGIKSKSAVGRDKFENYSSRIYLFPIESLISDIESYDEDDYFNAIYDSVRYYVTKFNTVKGTKDTYYVYLVNLKNTKFELYKDRMFSSNDACYILNYIKPDIVEKIGKI